jgi:hypothetical protein
MIVRDFTCAVCGGPRQTTENALIVMCGHCGAILTFGGDGLWKETGLAAAHEKGIQQLVKPNAAQARVMALTMEMQQLKAPEQRERWRMLAEEQVVVMAIAYPGTGMPMPTEPKARMQHVKAAVKMSELVTFDPKIAGLMGQFSAAAGAIIQGDPVPTARKMLETAKAYYVALAAHPDMPPGMMKEGPDHLAKELTRSSLNGYAPFLGNNGLERIRIEVFGDKTGSANCPKCGSPFDAPGMKQCRHCGAVTDIATEDAWTTAQLAIWNVSKADLVRRNQVDGPTPVITAIGAFLYTNIREVPPEKAYAYLQKAIPWVAQHELIGGLDMLAQSGNPDQRALLGGIRVLAMRWVPDPRQRPAHHVAQTVFAPPTPADEHAWIEMALGLWSARRGGLTEMLAQPLSAMQVAALHEQPTGVTARAAMAFFDRAWPGYDRRGMYYELSRLMAGYDHPRVRTFTTELAQLLAR